MCDITLLYKFPPQQVVVMSPFNSVIGAAAPTTLMSFYPLDLPQKKKGIPLNSFDICMKQVDLTS